jgi:hypothetical protein
MVTYPRSKFMLQHLPDPLNSFQLLAKAADASESSSHSYAHLARLAKVHVELDRSLSMGDHGFCHCLTSLLEPHLHPFKSDVLVGVPQERVGAPFMWPLPGCSTDGGSE